MNTPPGQMICPRMPSTPKHGSNFESPTGSPVRRRKQPAALKKEKSTSSQHTMSSQNSTGTLSPPPSSPIEPTATPRRSPRNMKRARFIIEEDEEKTTVTDDESDHERTSTRPTMINAGGMGLATPAKTPRRRKLPPADFASSSKVLFKSTTTTTTTTISKATTSKVVPRTPKKDIFASLKTSTPVRHIRKPSQIEIDEREEKEIEIFTDSDARRPKKGLDTNPFAKTGRASRSSARLRGERAEKFNELGEHAHRTDGMYYIFRGKKVFRSFDNLPNMESRGVENDEDGLNPADIKPRLLFPTVSNEEEENDDDVEHDVAHADIDNDEEVATDIDEEAETDIDEEAPSQSSIIISSPPNFKLKRRNVSRMTPDSDDEILSRKIAIASGPSKKSNKKRLSSNALFDDGEDGSFEISRGVIFSDNEEPIVKKGVKRGLDFGLDTPPRSSRKKSRKALF